MTNHPNRSRRGNPAAAPTPAQIRAAREAAGLTQEQAAASVHRGRLAWARWEAGVSPIDPACWELFARQQRAYR